MIRGVDATAYATPIVVLFAVTALGGAHQVGQFHFLRDDRLGVVILWYGWIATAALASAAIAFAVPRNLAERLWPGWAWLIPTAVVVGMLMYERRWFVS